MININTNELLNTQVIPSFIDPVMHKFIYKKKLNLFLKNKIKVITTITMYLILETGICILFITSFSMTIKWKVQFRKCEIRM